MGKTPRPPKKGSSAKKRTPPKRPRAPRKQPATPRAAAEEAAAIFESAVTPETYAKVHDEVLKRWNYCCAITGKRFASSIRPHPHLTPIAIRPLAAGGPLHAANFLPLTDAAAKAFESGHIIIGDDFEMWADLYRVDPELMERTVPLGKLALPKNPELWPDRAQLKWHRQQFLGA
jgi:hypothetical protein